MWYLDYFEYVKFNVDVYFFSFGPFFASFIQDIYMVIDKFAIVHRGWIKTISTL